MEAGSLPISWVKLFSINHGLNFPLFSGSILHLKCIGYDCGFGLGDSSYPVRIWRALSLPTLLIACIFLITLSFIAISQSLLSDMYLSPQFAQLDSFEHSLVFFSTCVVIIPAISAKSFSSASFLCVRICGNYAISWVGFGTFIQPYLMVIRGYRHYMAVPAG